MKRPNLGGFTAAGVLAVALVGGFVGAAAAMNTSAAGQAPVVVVDQVAGEAPVAAEPTAEPTPVATTPPAPDVEKEPATVAEPTVSEPEPEPEPAPAAGPDDSAEVEPVARAPKKEVAPAAEEQPAAPAAPELTEEQKAEIQAQAECDTWAKRNNRYVTDPDGRCENGGWVSTNECLRANDYRLNPGKEEGACVDGVFVKNPAPTPTASATTAPTPEASG